MFHRIGAAAYKADLTNTIALCEALGNPQNHFRTVHIAGTNGKGSTSNMLASILQEQGMKVGLFTSPHLKDFRERIRINGKMISKREVIDFVRLHQSLFTRIAPSFFEMTAAMAFDHFRKHQVDIAVIEVGLGGRLDSTNVIKPLLSVITNISFDHTQFLGDTLDKIAAEKAGIIKPGIPVVIGETQVETQQVFRKKAQEKGTEIVFADQEWFIQQVQRGSKAATKRSTVAASRFTRYDLKHQQTHQIIPIESPLGGNYQSKNIVTVAAICDSLIYIGVTIDRKSIQNGIKRVTKNTHFAGRWQIIARNPLTICDTGHNEGGIKEVLSQLGEIPFQKLHFVFGVVNDKEIDHILTMLPKDATYYFCKANIPRGLDASLLQEKATKQGLGGSVFPDVKSALQAAQKDATSEDLVFIGGSTFVVAEVL